MNWDDLKILAAIRDEQTYARAGKKLGLNETTVARRLSRIQSDLGFRLFDAVHGIRKPTLQCSALLVHVDHMMRHANNILSISENVQPISGHIRLTATPSLAEELLAPTLSHLLQMNSGLSLELLTSSESVNFSRWEADLALRLVKPDRGAFLVKKMGALHFYLIWPKDMPRDDEDCFVCAYPEELSGTPEMQSLVRDGFEERVRLRSANVRVLRSSILAGGCGGVLPGYMLGDLPDHPDFDVQPLGASRDVWLLIQPHLKEDAAARIVIEWLEQSLTAMC